jgi:hypothetical protein
MRSEAQIHAIREQLRTRQLTTGDVAESVIVALDWVTSTLVPDLALLDVAEFDEEGEYEPHAEEIMVALEDAVSPSNLPALEEFLARIGSVQLRDLAAAARKVDRLCKAETKKRDKPL